MSRASREAVAVLFRSLATTLASGVPLYRALDMVAQGSPDRAVQVACQKLQRDLGLGRRLSQAMAQWPLVFTRFQIGLIRVGEVTGHLDEVLDELARYEEKARDLTLKFRSTLTYPLLVSAFALLLMLLSPPLVVRLLAPFLEAQPDQIPWITRIYLGYCRLLCNPVSWLLSAGLAYGLVRLFRRHWAQPERRAWLWAHLLRLPGLGNLLRNFAVARFSRAFAAQVQVGISPFQALQLSAQVSGDPLLMRDIALAQKALRDGQTLVRSLQRTGYFSKSFLGILRAAEECGTLADDFRRMAEFYELELDHTTASFAATLEPLVMMALGVMAGFMIFAVTLPMLRMVETCL